MIKRAYHELSIRTVIAALLAGIAAFTSGFALAGETVGPKGESQTPYDELQLSDTEVAELQKGEYTAALLWHSSGEWIDAITAGATDEFARMGVKVIAETDAAYDAAKQQSDVETVMAKSPSVILTLPVDPASSASAFRPAIDAGTKLVLLSNVPDGYEHGKDYVGIATDDIYQMGAYSADALASAIGDQGEVAMIFYDAAYYVTNQYDQAFRETILANHPNIKIVAEQGFSDPARAEEIASALLLKYPDLDGIYVTWSQPAEGVLSALRSAGNSETKLVTLGISEPLALDMINDGNVAAIVVDRVYDLGRALAIVAAYGLLDKPAPAFVTVGPAVTVTKANVAEGWTTSLHIDPPGSITAVGN